MTKEFDLLKAQLLPVETISLRRLSAANAASFIRLYAEKQHLHWTQAHIEALTELTEGYPPGLLEMIKTQINNPLT